MAELDLEEESGPVAKHFKNAKGINFSCAYVYSITAGAGETALAVNIIMTSDRQMLKALLLKKLWYSDGKEGT